MSKIASFVSAPIATGTGSGQKWILTVTAPASQDIVVDFVVSHNGTAADAAQLRYEVMRVTDPASGDVLTGRVKDNRLDDADVTSSVRADGSATVGAILDSRYIHPQSAGAFGTYVVKQGTSIGLRMHQTNASVNVLATAVVRE